MARAHGRSPAKVSENIMLAEIALRQRKVWIPIIGMMGVAGALIFGGMWFPARELAGQTTKVDVQIYAALTLTVSLSLAGASAFWGSQQKGRATDLESKNRVLARDIKELQRRLKDNGLPSDVTR